MNLTSTDWITIFRQSNFILSNNFTQDILLIIGFLTVCLFLFLLILQFAVKVRQIYRTSQPEIRSKQLRYPSYQKLLNLDNRQCKCFHYSCLTKFQCIKPTCQISNYEQIYRNSPPTPTSSNSACIGIHNSFV